MKRLFSALLVLTFALSAGTQARAAQPTAPAATSGFRAQSGSEARAFRVPADVRVAWTATDARSGIVQTRYQQVVGGADVYGGQVTTLRNRAGDTLAVIGAHYPSLKAVGSVKLTGQAARDVAAREVGSHGKWEITLSISPQTGNRFYVVDTQRFTARWIFHIDAETGRKLKKYNAIQHSDDVGVKGDTKQIDAKWNGTAYEMTSSDGRQKTYDAKQANTSRKLPGTLFTDADNTWNLLGRTSPSHPAGVDAHYYSNVTDDFYFATFNRNSLNNSGMAMVSSVHYGSSYDNAFWNGSQMVYGDGSQTAGGFRELSGGLDVVAHELTHGVTDFTSNLVYQDESGALNEAFSDMMGNSTEFYAEANSHDPSVEADWQIGEDVYISPTSNAVAGFRNMADPKEDGDPDHYSERYTGTEDNGGVHSNSGIPNHAYYLLVNGGKNAGCDAIGSGGHSHTADCEVSVASIGVADAQQIFYKAFTSLNSTATMGQARAATEATADALFGDGSQQTASTSAAWQAVGVYAGAAPAPTCDVANATLPFESEHPYKNNITCTWTFNAGSPNFRFHFSLLDVERNYDYVDILDANGKVLESITGPKRGGYTSVLVPTSVGQVRLRTDASVTKQGFTVDSILR